MTEIENAIKGLKYLHDVEHWTPDEDDENVMARRKITEEAIALLKEQEPRVMTYDEVKALDRTESTVYVERRTKTFYNEMAFVNVEKVYGEDIIFHGQKSIFGHKKKDYGKKWRCWTAWPDEKTRVETPWDSGVRNE